MRKPFHFTLSQLMFSLLPCIKPYRKTTVTALSYNFCRIRPICFHRYSHHQYNHFCVKVIDGIIFLLSSYSVVGVPNHAPSLLYRHLFMLLVRHGLNIIISMSTTKQPYNQLISSSFLSYYGTVTGRRF
jgi:hypothetical protein